jgi:hypothetical protein
VTRQSRGSSGSIVRRRHSIEGIERAAKSLGSAVELATTATGAARRRLQRLARDAR